MRFKGNHLDKIRITYKAKGDDLQVNDICDEGYCYQVYTRNERAPKKYSKQGISLIYSHTMDLFDSLKEDHHQVGMENIYKSAAFCRAAYHHDRKVLCHSVDNKAVRSITECVIQYEDKNPVAHWAEQGTVRAAVLEGNTGCPNLIASSVYDTKPVHDLSMVFESIQGVEKEKMVYNVDTSKVEALNFLRLNEIDKYNNGMGDVDLWPIN